MTGVAEYWTPEPIWSGQEAHVLASGPGATPEVIRSLRGRNVVVVNATALSAPWAPVWFFSDPEVLFRKRRSTEPRIAADGTDMVAFAEAFKGLIVTTARRVKVALGERVHLVAAARLNEFPRPGSPVVRMGRSSGQTAIGLAAAFGASSVVLHGFDMRLVDGREHHHDEYEGGNPGIYAEHFVPAFAGWNATALRAGVTIVNATPGSALTEFPMIETMEKSR